MSHVSAGTNSGAASATLDCAACDARRVLVVDDVPDIVTTFRRIINMTLPALLVDEAFNGEEALVAFREKHHCLVLLDLKMPVRDGQSAFLEMEAHCRENCWQMPAVVFCTAYAPSASIDDLVHRDARHTVLMKPVQVSELVAAVKARLPAH